MSPTAWRATGLLVAILAIVVLARIVGIGERLGALREWIQGLAPWGPVVFFFLYAAAVVAAVPGSALTVAAGTPAAVSAAGAGRRRASPHSDRLPVAGRA